ncbi:MAG TPA: phosphatase PAP2 family protein [Acidobacteriota bacterium]|jgi:hypothetical protein|nr:phosphatase PAP2 family protein [Acidobacteriota bacterium]HNU00310.1 phosphatase PAP2 family protein [Acidobacteriota bacterium]HPB27177.1 phosphatase PAP2 family protein [Acidobacteriota bacterium]HQO24982.1 phosphatase PAP2 family protein [Acidobacteriota bacterium]HQP73247.1 phosphatase PAP2 family protein [Acidobacteriota bacterium]
MDSSTDYVRTETQALDRPGLRPADLAVLVFIGLLSLLVLLNYREIPSANRLLMVHVFIASILIYAARFPVKGSPWWIKAIRLWHPPVFITVLFGHLVEIIPAATAADRDQLLIRWDLWLFGQHPSVFLGQFQFPLLTELLQYVYTCFYFIPLGLAIVIVARRRLELYDYFYFLICYGFFFSYLGYFLIPAVGPRFTLQPLYAEPLQGVLLYDHMVNLLNYLESVNRDCFPSGHVMMTLVTLHFAWRHEKTAFRVLLLPGLLLIVGTVYLRYHYLVDLVAALGWYLFVFYTAPHLYRMALRVVFAPARQPVWGRLFAPAKNRPAAWEDEK